MSFNPVGRSSYDAYEFNLITDLMKPVFKRLCMYALNNIISDEHTELLLKNLRALLDTMI